MIEGKNKSEDRLIDLCRKSFLRFWTYPNLHYRKDTGEVAELCDLLVIFESKIIIFQDKVCDNINLDKLQEKGVDVIWNRVLKRINKAATQAIGAQNFILNSEKQKKLYTDETCQTFVDLDFSPFNENDIYRVITIGGLNEVCEKIFEPESIGSLALDFSLVGKVAHKSPFTIGHLISQDKFIHIWNDNTVDQILSEFDTIRDFQEYLANIELHINSKYYLTHPQSEQFIKETSKDFGYRIEFAGQEQLTWEFVTKEKMGLKYWMEPTFPNPSKSLMKIKENAPLLVEQKKQLSIGYEWDKFINKLEKRNSITDVQCNHKIIYSFKNAMEYLAFFSRVERARICLNLDNFLHESKCNGYSSSSLKMPNGILLVFVKTTGKFRRMMKKRRHERSVFLASVACDLLWKKGARAVIGLYLEKSKEERPTFEAPSICIHFKNDEQSRILANCKRENEGRITLPLLKDLMHQFHGK